MEAAAVCTNRELFIGWCEKPVYKEGTGGGGSSPATVPWKGRGLPTGRGQEGFPEPASTSRMGLRTPPIGRKAELVDDESPGQPRTPLRGPQPTVGGDGVRCGRWVRDRAPSLSYIQVSLPLRSRGGLSRPCRRQDGSGG